MPSTFIVLLASQTFFVKQIYHFSLVEHGDSGEFMFIVGKF